MLNFPGIAYFHKETRRIGPIPSDDSLWPESWKKVEFKEYPRFPSFPLPKPVLPNVSFEEVLHGRASRRRFNSSETLDNKTLSAVLHFAAGISRPNENLKKSMRFYPSGGARYPLELYVSFRGNETIPRGVYHYNVREHSLEQIGGAEEEGELRNLPSYPWVKDAAVACFITSIFDRSMRKYAERGYRFSVIEAGILLESFYMVTNALGVGCCAVGSNNDEQIERVLDVDDLEEGFLLQFAFGLTV